MEQLFVRRADVTDVPEMVRLRGVMFRDMGVDLSSDAWKVTTTARLTRDLAVGVVIGAVVDRVSRSGLCASGVLQIHEVLGSPHFQKGVAGHVGSVAVDTEWRRRGVGERVLTFLIDEARVLGVERLELHATPAGEAIYRRLGFRDRQGGVELRLEL